MSAMPTLQDLFDTLPQRGTLRWIGLRPARREPMSVVDEAMLATDSGLVGDRYAGSSGTRQVTLLQYEHVDTIASLLGRPVTAHDLRRNLLVSGINLMALKNRRFSLGEAVLEHTGACHPCSRMERNLGAGGYNAVRGHGGITARVVQGGRIASGDALAMLPVQR